MPCSKFLRDISGEQTVWQLFGWFVGGLSMFLGSYAFQSDLDWNDIMLGRDKLKIKGNTISGGFTLNLTKEQQNILMRNAKLEIIYLVGLGLFLTASIAIYTFLWIKGNKIKPSYVSCSGAAFHGFGSIILAVLSICELNGLLSIAAHDRKICSGVFDKSLHMKSSNELLKFLQDATCVCSHIEKTSAFRNKTYDLESLQDLGICQHGLVKQIASITLFFYTMIAFMLACTQLKDVMVIKSAAAHRPSTYRSSVKPVGYNRNSVRPQCTCSKTASKVDDDEPANENNNVGFEEQEVNLNVPNDVVYDEMQSMSLKVNLSQTADSDSSLQEVKISYVRNAKNKNTVDAENNNNDINDNHITQNC